MTRLAHVLPRFLRTSLLTLALAALVAACGDDGAKQSDAGDAKSASPPPAAAPAADSSGSGEGKQYSAPPKMTIDPAKKYTATLVTKQGTIEIELLPKEAPNAVNNFVFLAREGFYSKVPIHRIIDNFMWQSGDPTGTGQGGPGYNIKDDPVKLNYKHGIVAMANTGQPDSAGSQFFIVLGEDAGLPKTYTIFGKVSKGLDVVDKIGKTPTDVGPSGEPSKPTEPRSIDSITIAEA